MFSEVDKLFPDEMIFILGASQYSTYVGFRQDVIEEVIRHKMWLGRSLQRIQLPFSIDIRRIG